MYANLSSGKTNSNGAYTVDPTETYNEPTVFTQVGTVLTLVNFEYAYGNLISNSIDNPFKIDVF